MRNFSNIIGLLVLTLAGCSQAPSHSSGQVGEAEASQNLCIALDTSGSAEASRVTYLKAMRSLVVDNRYANLTLFRFDSNPAEIYSGKVMPNEEEASVFLAKYVKYSAGTEGTNLLKLLNLIDKQVKRTDRPTEIVILTDCGFENMPNKELEETKVLVKTWTSNPRIKSIMAKGVADGNREKLRALFDAAADKFSIE